ncbi:hypothetical protein JX266_006664 [Neoarthrinium moseri]|nr:hypothetical protein JX266_006664 [Neoarthrinium moseri]
MGYLAVQESESGRNLGESALAKPDTDTVTLPLIAQSAAPPPSPPLHHPPPSLAAQPFFALPLGHLSHQLEIRHNPPKILTASIPPNSFPQLPASSSRPSRQKTPHFASRKPPAAVVTRPETIQTIKMPAQKQWDEEESDASTTPPSSPPAGVVRRGNKFDDEEGEDSDVLDSWDAAEDSEVEREKAKKAAEAKAKADAEAAAAKKSKKQRILEHQAERARQLAEGSDSEDETEAERRERLKRTEIESDLNHAADLFSGIGVTTRKTTTAGSAIPIDPKDPTKTVDLGSLPLLNPQTKLQFENMRSVLVPIIGNNSKKAHYTLFLQEFSKQLAKDLPSDQIKKIASTLTALSNEKLKEEKAAEKGGKKTKAQKTKTTLVTSRANTQDTATYDDDFGDDDFM